MSAKMDYEHIADALEVSIYSLQKSLYVLLNSYGNWQVSFGLPDSAIARYERYLRFNPYSVREFRESRWFK